MCGEEQYRRLYYDGAKNLLHSFRRATLIFTTHVFYRRRRNHVRRNASAEPRHEKHDPTQDRRLFWPWGIVARGGHSVTAFFFSDHSWKHAVAEPVIAWSIMLRDDSSAILLATRGFLRVEI